MPHKKTTKAIPLQRVDLRGLFAWFNDDGYKIFDDRASARRYFNHLY
jgi:hypothetical protein